MDLLALLNYVRGYKIDNSSMMLRNGSVSELNLKILNKRLYDARKAFLLLYDNGMHTDSALIAGHILEICAAIYYIKSAKDKDLNTRRYVAKCSVSSAYDLLAVDDSELQNEEYKLAIQEFLDYLQDVGHLILRPSKKEDKKQFNKELISKLSATDKTNNDKRKLLKEYYEMPVVNDYLNCFVSGLYKGLKDNENENAQKLAQAIRLFYISYCRIKHASALMYPGYPDDEKIIIGENTETLWLPAVFLSLDIIAENPIYIK